MGTAEYGSSNVKCMSIEKWNISGRRRLRAYGQVGIAITHANVVATVAHRQIAETLGTPWNNQKDMYGK
jgi:hypothetical protein